MDLWWTIYGVILFGLLGWMAYREKQRLWEDWELVAAAMFTWLSWVVMSWWRG